MNHRLLIATTLVLASAGCAHFTSRPLDAGSTATQLTARRLGARRWTLSALVDEAVKNHTDIALTQAQYETAKATIVTAGERLNPTITVGPQIVTPFKLNAGSYALDFDWPIETAGKRGHRLAQAHEQVRAAALRITDASWQVRSRVRKALLELYAGQSKKVLIEAEVVQQQQVVAAMNVRVAAGELGRPETIQARLLLAQFQLQSADATKASILGKASLAEALGMSVEGLAGATFAFAPFENRLAPRNIRALQRAALTQRADVLASLADYVVAEAALRLEIAKQYPDIHLNPGYQFDAGLNKWALGFTITPPLLSHNAGPIAEAEGKRAEAAAKFNSVQAKALAEVERAEAGINAAQLKFTMTQSLLVEQEKQLVSAKKIAAVGAADHLSVVAAQLEHDAAAAARLDAHVEFQQALGDLEAATQTTLQ